MGTQKHDLFQHNFRYWKVPLSENLEPKKMGKTMEKTIRKMIVSFMVGFPHLCYSSLQEGNILQTQDLC